MIRVTVQCPDGSIEQQSVAAVRVTGAAIGDLIAVAAQATMRGSAGDLSLFVEGNAALTSAVLTGSGAYSHPATTADGGRVLTAGGASGTGFVTFRSDVWSSIRSRSATAVVDPARGLRVCGVVAHEGMHLALSARGTPDPGHRILTPALDRRVGCR